MRRKENKPNTKMQDVHPIPVADIDGHQSHYPGEEEEQEQEYEQEYEHKYEDEDEHEDEHEHHDRRSNKVRNMYP
jgi:hypothetical protein